MPSRRTAAAGTPAAAGVRRATAARGAAGDARAAAEATRNAQAAAEAARYARMLAALGTEPRLRIVRLLLAAHPQGLVVGEIAEELGMPGPTLSHHLERLRREELVQVQREGTFLRCRAHAAGLEALLGFLYAECCTRNKAVPARRVRACCP